MLEAFFEGISKQTESYLLMSQVSIIALDLTMVLGTALGLSLLFRIPVLPCILVSGLDTLVLVLLPQLGTNKAERLTVSCLPCHHIK